MYRYLTDYRMKEAVRLLRDTALPVSEVAVSCGFKHFSHFSKCFAGKTSFTPRDFRKQ